MIDINNVRQSIQLEMNRLRAKMRQGADVTNADIAFSLGTMYGNMDQLCEHIAVLEEGQKAIGKTIIGEA